MTKLQLQELTHEDLINIVISQQTTIKQLQEDLATKQKEVDCYKYQNDYIKSELKFRLSYIARLSNLGTPVYEDDEDEW